MCSSSIQYSTYLIPDKRFIMKIWVNIWGWNWLGTHTHSRIGPKRACPLPLCLPPSASHTAHSTQLLGLLPSLNHMGLKIWKLPSKITPSTVQILVWRGLLPSTALPSLPCLLFYCSLLLFPSIFSLVFISCSHSQGYSLGLVIAFILILYPVSSFHPFVFKTKT